MVRLPAIRYESDHLFYCTINSSSYSDRLYKHPLVFLPQVIQRLLDGLGIRAGVTGDVSCLSIVWNRSNRIEE